jgi:hypothetical protein
VPGDFNSYGLTLVEEFLGIGGIQEQIGCAKGRRDVASTVILEGYLVVSAILLLNMLIAMMAETFSEVRANQEEEYAYLNSQMVVSIDMDLGDCPAPISVLRLPARIVSDAIKIRDVSANIVKEVHSRMTVGGGGGGGGAAGQGKAYASLEEEEDDGKEVPDYANYTHVPVEELMTLMAEVDFESEKNNLADLILGVERGLIESGGIKESLIKGAPKAEEAVATNAGRAEDVTAYSGYTEEASRLVFHYADNFAHLRTNPEGRTYLPSGVCENEAKALPIRMLDEAPDKSKGEKDMTAEEMSDKLKTRGLVSYPFPQKVPQKEGKEIIEASDDTFVYERPNGELGLSQIWPIKVNKQFFERFKVSTTNPDPRVFQPQAIGEFTRSIEKLFGKGATQRAPVYYALNKNQNKKPIFKGNSEALQDFLRKSPKVCDDLKIAKLYPGGFISTISIGGNPAKGEPPKKNNFKHFDFTPGIEYVLYTKQGYESMACIKGYFQFVKECELGPRDESLEYGVGSELQA